MRTEAADAGAAFLAGLQVAACAELGAIAYDQAALRRRHRRRPRPVDPCHRAGRARPRPARLRRHRHGRAGRRRAGRHRLPAVARPDGRRRRSADAVGRLGDGRRSVTLTAVGFAPGETVDVTLHSTPIALGTLTADAAGAVEGDVTIPADVEPGYHTIELVGQTSARPVEVAVEVDAPRSPTTRSQLPATGSPSAALASVAAALLVVGGALVAEGRRRRAGASRLMARRVRRVGLALAARSSRWARRRPRCDRRPRPRRRAVGGACTDSTGITVVVDFAAFGDGVQVRCAPQPVRSGFDALTQAGFTYQGTVRVPRPPLPHRRRAGDGPVPRRAPAERLLGLLARSDAAATGPTAPPAPAAACPPPGSVEGWAFGDEAEPGDRPAGPAARPRPPARPTTTTTPAARVAGPRRRPVPASSPADGAAARRAPVPGGHEHDVEPDRRGRRRAPRPPSPTRRGPATTTRRPRRGRGRAVAGGRADRPTAARPPARCVGRRRGRRARRGRAPVGRRRRGVEEEPA